MLTDAELARYRAHAEGNPSPRGDRILRLVAEVERLRTEGRGLFSRLETLRAAWIWRRDVARREAAGGPSTEALTLGDCIDELDAAIDNRLTDAEEAEAQRLYAEFQRDVASGNTWGLDPAKDAATERSPG